MRIISDGGHRVSAGVVRVIQLVSTADSRTERLRLLLIASNSCHSIHCIARTYLIQPSLMSAGFPKRRPRIVAAPKRAAKKVVATASDRRNTVCLV